MELRVEIRDMQKCQRLLSLRAGETNQEEISSLVNQSLTWSRCSPSRLFWENAYYGRLDLTDIQLMVCRLIDYYYASQE
jgi:hypothetical protein